MTNSEWDSCRRTNGSIKLVSAFQILNNGDNPTAQGEAFLLMIESEQPIYSRQVAAVAIATATMYR